MQQMALLSALPHLAHFSALPSLCSCQEDLCLVLIRLTRHHLRRHQLPHLQQVALCFFCNGARLLHLLADSCDVPASY